MLIWINQLVKMEKDKFEGEYFVFCVNPGSWERALYGDMVDDYRLLFCKENGKLIPQGDKTRNYLYVDTDHAPDKEDIVEFLENKNVKRVFTSYIPQPKNNLWGLSNCYVPMGWNYEEDPHPVGMVYYPADNDQSGKHVRLGESSLIEIVYLEDKDLE